MAKAVGKCLGDFSLFLFLSLCLLPFDIIETNLVICCQDIPGFVARSLQVRSVYVLSHEGLSLRPNEISMARALQYGYTLLAFLHRDSAQLCMLGLDPQPTFSCRPFQEDLNIVTVY